VDYKYVQRSELLILLLCGGDKSTQAKDIQRAKVLASQPINMEGGDDA